MSRGILVFSGALAAVAVADCFRDGGEKTFGFGGAVLLEEGAFDRVDADLLIAGGDLTFGLRTTPETVRLRTGVGIGDSLDLTKNGWEDDRRCGVVLMFWSCWVSGFRRGCLDEDSETGVSDFVLSRQLARSQSEGDE